MHEVDLTAIGVTHHVAWPGVHDFHKRYAFRWSAFLTVSCYLSKNAKRPTRPGMRTLAALLLSVVLTSSAQADACWFEAPSGDRLTFLDNGENEVVRQYADGQTETCVYGHADDGASTIWCDYESETQSTLSSL